MARRHLRLTADDHDDLAEIHPEQSARAVGYDVEAIRADFPILAQKIHGKPLVYLDNGASAQKPRR